MVDPSLGYETTFDSSKVDWVATTGVDGSAPAWVKVVRSHPVFGTAVVASHPPMSTVLIPIPDHDFDPTEVAVSWWVLTAQGHHVTFATESGAPAAADDIMVTGRGLDIWSAVPVLGRLALVGRMLRANKDARRAYAQMISSPEYRQPVSWTQVTLDGIDALLLPGGHRARGMRSYIDSDTLHRLVVEAFTRGLFVAAICHGVLLAARSIDPRTGRSVLYGHKTTA